MADFPWDWQVIVHRVERALNKVSVPLHFPKMLLAVTDHHHFSAWALLEEKTSLGVLVN